MTNSGSCTEVWRPRGWHPPKHMRLIATLRWHATNKLHFAVADSLRTQARKAVEAEKVLSLPRPSCTGQRTRLKNTFVSQRQFISTEGCELCSLAGRQVRTLQDPQLWLSEVEICLSLGSRERAELSILKVCTLPHLPICQPQDSTCFAEMLKAPLSEPL